MIVVLVLMFDVVHFHLFDFPSKLSVLFLFIFEFIYCTYLQLHPHPIYTYERVIGETIDAQLNFVSTEEMDRF